MSVTSQGPRERGPWDTENCMTGSPGKRGSHTTPRGSRGTNGKKSQAGPTFLKERGPSKSCPAVTPAA